MIAVLGSEAGPASFGPDAFRAARMSRCRLPPAIGSRAGGTAASSFHLARNHSDGARLRFGTVRATAAFAPRLRDNSVSVAKLVPNVRLGKVGGSSSAHGASEIPSLPIHAGPISVARCLVGRNARDQRSGPRATYLEAEAGGACRRFSRVAGLFRLCELRSRGRWHVSLVHRLRIARHRICPALAPGALAAQGLAAKLRLKTIAHAQAAYGFTT